MTFTHVATELQNLITTVSLPFDVRRSVDVICLEASMTTRVGPSLTFIPPPFF